MPFLRGARGSVRVRGGQNKSPRNDRESMFSSVKMTIQNSFPTLETALFHAKNDPEIGGRILGFRHLKRAPQNTLFEGRPRVREGAWRAKTDRPEMTGEVCFFFASKSS